LTTDSRIADSKPPHSVIDSYRPL